MRLAFLTTCILTLSLFACNQSKSTLSYFGEPINPKGAETVSKLPTLMEAGTLENVKVEGKIDACCQAKGCWLTMKLDEEQQMRVRFKDYGFFVPTDAAGKTAIIQGRAFYDTVSVDMLRHYAIDAGLSASEAAAKYTKPEVSINFEATGVIIKEDASK